MSGIPTQKMKENNVQADIQVNIVMEQYLVQYMYDLLGVRTLTEMIEYISIKTYLANKKSISDIQVKSNRNTNQQTSTIDIVFYSNDIFQTLKEFRIPYTIEKKPKYDILHITIGRAFLMAFFSSFQAIDDLGIIPSLFPDKTIIPKTQFPQHIAWAFSDYEEPQTITNDVEHSSIDFFLKKDTDTFPPNKDKGWQHSDSNTEGGKQKRFAFTSIIYSDEQTLSIIY